MATRSSSSPPSPSHGQISLFGVKEAPDAFRKAVQVVHSKPKSPLTLLQRKLGNAWTKHAIESEPDANGWWTLGIRDLERDVGFDSNNRQHLKDSAEALMRIVFEWDVMAPTAKRVPWKASVLFPEIEIHSDVIRYQISSQLRELIVNPEIYAMIDMNVVRRFRRASSLAIWEYCVRFEKLGRTSEVEWEKFRDMVLGETAEARTYAEYKYFKSKVLKPAIAEINSESNLSIELVEAKVGKRVRSVRFELERKASGTDGVVEDGVSLELVGEMVRLGVMQSEARRLLQSHSPQQLRAAVDYTKRRMADRRAEKLENPAAYFRHALQHEYGNPPTVEAPKAPVERIDLREAFLVGQAEEAERYFKELDASEQSLLIERYNEQQGTSVLRLKKRATKPAEVAFLRWLAQDTWGAPTSDELLHFAQEMLSKRK
jgi:hypothetical protein